MTGDQKVVFGFVPTNILHQPLFLTRGIKYYSDRLLDIVDQEIIMMRHSR